MLNPTVPDVYSAQMNTEEYLNHPTFGLLYKICLVEKNRGLFSTLYAQRLFFSKLGYENSAAPDSSWNIPSFKLPTKRRFYNRLQ